MQNASRIVVHYLENYCICHADVNVWMQDSKLVVTTSNRNLLKIIMLHRSDDSAGQFYECKKQNNQKQFKAPQKL